MILIKRGIFKLADQPLQCLLGKNVVGGDFGISHGLTYRFNGLPLEEVSIIRDRQMNYQTYLDEHIWQFIRDTARHFPDDAAQLSIAEQRRVYDSMCHAFAVERPCHLRVVDGKAGAVGLRHYSAGGGDACIVYFHGGGFVMGGLDSHDDVCAEICAATGYDVIAVDYRLAPEHRHPAMFDDALAATRHVLAMNSLPLLLCGDSAGGNLAAAVAHALRGVTERIAGQLLIYPALGGDLASGSYVQHAAAPMLSRDDVIFYETIRVEGQPPCDDPTYAPLMDREFAGLPPTVVISAECDPLSDDGRDYCERIAAADGGAHWINEPGLVHGYLRARHSVPRAAQSFTRIISALHDLGHGIWPGDR